MFRLKDVTWRPLINSLLINILWEVSRLAEKRKAPHQNHQRKVPKQNLHQKLKKQPRQNPREELKDLVQNQEERVR